MDVSEGLDNSSPIDHEPDDFVADAVDLETTEADADPVHLAKCAECATAVRFRSNITGTGFFLVDADPEAVFGVGENGRPICPNGHGEMGIADEQLKPAAEAFAEVAQRQAAGTPQQAALPGVFPPFNYEGVFREIVEQAQRVERLKSQYEDAKQEASDAKKALDKGAELLMSMTLEFERRRREKPDPEATEAKRSQVACIWTQQHPEDPCPFCAELSIDQRAEIVRILGGEILPREANGHADQVVEYRTRVDVQETLDALDGLVYDLHPATVAEWSPEDRAAVRAWVTGQTSWEDMPAVLGRPHVAAIVTEDAKVQTCGSVLRTFDDLGDAYPAGARVRTDCVGAQAEPTHHYPEKSRKKKSGKKGKR